MEFEQVIQTCLDFSIANGGTIQSFGAQDGDKLEVQSRTTRTEILVERCKTEAASGVWQVQQTLNAAGEHNTAKEKVSTAEHLLKYLSRFWDKDGVDILP